MRENQSIPTGFAKAPKILVEKWPAKEDASLSFKTQPPYAIMGLSCIFQEVPYQ